jgi:8-oxo-dGTP diphosphatase
MRGEKLLFIFDGGTLDAEELAAIRLQPAELRSYAFHDLATADALLIPRLARRVAAALDARRADCPRYLEHGATPSAALPN